MTSPVAKLTFWGVRGSTATVDPATWRYGGNTPCVELTTPAGMQLVLDCGTGLRMFGSRWGKEEQRHEKEVVKEHHKHENAEAQHHHGPGHPQTAEEAELAKLTDTKPVEPAASTH